MFATPIRLCPPRPTLHCILQYDEVFMTELFVDHNNRPGRSRLVNASVTGAVAVAAAAPITSDEFG